MAEGLNPFMTDDFIENEVENNRFRGEEPEKVNDISLDAVASKLIKDKFLLTALELHTELVESGRELARLRDYFSNPVNFELQVLTKAEMSPGLPRTASVQTFDSLDFARYSDDGERQVDERVAVLEFEIRKARETIKALRADLTMATESSGNTPDSAHEHSLTDGAPMRPHEKRALNFLVNEYLLHNNYKLASITFSDENEDQDFEDWDEVGLNIPKPPDILHLYRDFGQHQSPLVSKQDFSCHVNMEDEDMDEQREQCNQIKEQMEIEMADMRDQITLLTRENEALLSLIKNLEKEIVNLNAYRSTPAASPMNTPTRKNSDSARSGDSSEGCNGPNINKHSCQTLKGLLDSQNQLDNISNDTTSHTEDSMEIDINLEVNKPFVTHTIEIGNNDTRWRSNSLLENNCIRKVSPAFHKALLSMTCAHKLSQESRLALEVSEVADSNEKAVLMLGRCLPHIVPNVLLAKREELIPLILCTVSLHPDVKDRDKLLNILFNLIKRPDDEQRQMILTGCVTFAQHVGPTRVEAELLPQCWEQIGHKYPERRLLVAESCGVLAPYLPNEIRSSLLLSMLQQMLTDDKADTVREAVTKSLGLLMAFIDDKDKYSQGSELLLAALSDLSEKTVAAALHIFLPAFAAWAFELGKLEKDLIEMLLKKLENFVKNCSGMNTTVDDQHLILLVRALQCLVPFLFASVLQSGPYMERLVTDPDPYDDTRFPDTISPLEDLTVIVGDRLHVSILVTTYERHIAEEWYENWSSFDWVSKQLIPRFLKALNSLDVSILKGETIQILAALFTDLCRTFGRTFTQTKIKPQFQEELKVSEEQLDTQVLSGKTALTSCTVPVYVTGVLTAHNQEEDRKEMTTFLQELLCTLSLCHAPLDSIRATFALLGSSAVHHELLLAVLWDGVVHTSALVRTSAAHVFELLVGVISDNLLGSRVVPGLITLAGDPEISVRIATIPTFGIIMETSPQREMLEKVYLQFQAFMDDPIYKDQHALQVEIIRTFGRMGPNAEPKFRDEFVLPRLAILATHNNHVTNETKKTDISMALFEAYSALSCCFINDQLISEVMLPGLRCLRQDLSQIALEHEEVVASMIRDYENKLDFGRPLERSLSVVSAASSGSVDDVRHKVISKFKDFKDKSSNRPNIANIFSRKK